MCCISFASFCTPSHSALHLCAFKGERGRDGGGIFCVVETELHLCMIVLSISRFIFFYYHHLICFAQCLSLPPPPSLSIFPINLLLLFCLCLAPLLPSAPPHLCPPTWPRCFVSGPFSLTVSMARLLCILAERTACLPSPNPRPLHNYRRPWRRTGRLTPASGWRGR